MLRDAFAHMSDIEEISASIWRTRASRCPGVHDVFDDAQFGVSDRSGVNGVEECGGALSEVVCAVVLSDVRMRRAPFECYVSRRVTIKPVAE